MIELKSTDKIVSLLGLRQPPETKLDGVVLPGAILQHLYALPQSWMPSGHSPRPMYLLSECYQLTPDSYAFRDPDTHKPPHGHVCWKEIALHKIKPGGHAPPAPGFWDALYLTRHDPLSIPAERLRRLIGGARMYFPAWRMEQLEQALLVVESGAVVRSADGEKTT
ncbi:MAG: hypothetical protein KGI71_06355 [Patescibacteria group bacterium]|nr:hypothetical protein [Patescibacteria group bacterium]